jgi:hypothetical protein
MIIPKLTHFCDVEVTLSAPMEMGPGRAGQRRIIPITGGTVSGRVSGTVLNLGADWQTIFGDGSADIDTRYAFKTDDGALIEIVNKGVRHGPPDVLAAIGRGEDVDPASYYFRTTARLETGDPRYDWINRTLFVGTAQRLASAVKLSLFEVG